MSAFIVPGAATWRSCCGALCATCATLIVAILIGSSFHELTPVQMGLDYDGLAHRVNDKILYENGRWFLGPAHSFIVFPRTTRSILMRSAEADSGVISDQQFSSLTARTSDGLAVEMETGRWKKIREDRRRCAHCNARKGDAEHAGDRCREFDEERDDVKLKLR